jgi:hypothetical protein
MVNFNNDATIGTPAIDIQRVSILQRRYELIETFEDYKKKAYRNDAVPIHTVRARLLSLFIEIQATLKRRMKEPVYTKLRNIVKNSNSTEDEIYSVIEQINEELDIMRLIRIDTQKVYDSTNVEEENKEKGY